MAENIESFNEAVRHAIRTHMRTIAEEEGKEMERRVWERVQKAVDAIVPSVASFYSARMVGHELVITVKKLNMPEPGTRQGE